MSGRILQRRKNVAPYQSKSGVAALALGRDVAWGCSVRHRGTRASGVLQRGEAVCSYIKSSPQTLLVSMWISMALLMLVPELQRTALWMQQIAANTEVRLEDFKSVFPLAEHGGKCCDHSTACFRLSQLLHWVNPEGSYACTPHCPSQQSVIDANCPNERNKVLLWIRYCLKPLKQGKRK